MRVRKFEIVAIAVLMAAPACAAGVQVSDAWIRALPAGLPAAGYFTLHNTGAVPVDLTGADSKACGMLMLHKSTPTSMEDVQTVAIAPGGTLKFTPGSYHLMCMNPTGAVAPGGKVSVTLNFSDGAKVTSDFPVKDAKGE